MTIAPARIVSDIATIIIATSVSAMDSPFFELIFFMSGLRHFISKPFHLYVVVFVVIIFDGSVVVSVI